MGSAPVVAGSLEEVIGVSGGPKSLIFIVFYSYLTIWPTKGGQGTPRALQGTAKTSPMYPAEPHGTLKGPVGPLQDPLSALSSSPGDSPIIQKRWFSLCFSTVRPFGQPRVAKGRQELSRHREKVPEASQTAPRESERTLLDLRKTP